MRHYEIATVLHPDLEIDLDNATKKIESIITGAGGTIDRKDSWGKRKLAYRINGQDWGIFVFYQVSLEPKQVTSIEASLKIADEVMRHLVVSLEHPKLVHKRKANQKPPTQAKDQDQTTQDKVGTNEQESEEENNG